MRDVHHCLTRPSSSHTTPQRSPTGCRRWWASWWPRPWPPPRAPASTACRRAAPRLPWPLTCSACRLERGGARERFFSVGSSGQGLLRWRRRHLSSSLTTAHPHPPLLALPRSLPPTPPGVHQHADGALCGHHVLQLAAHRHQPVHQAPGRARGGVRRRLGPLGAPHARWRRLLSGLSAGRPPPVAPFCSLDTNPTLLSTLPSPPRQHCAFLLTIDPIDTPLGLTSQPLAPPAALTSPFTACLLACLTVADRPPACKLAVPLGGGSTEWQARERGGGMRSTSGGRAVGRPALPRGRNPRPPDTQAPCAMAGRDRGGAEALARLKQYDYKAVSAWRALPRWGSPASACWGGLEACGGAQPPCWVRPSPARCRLGAARA